MAPLYNPAKEKDVDAKSCIDQFEFPNIPCEYPLVWVRASEAAQICQAQGKRLCDAHEWEGACDGSLEAPDYFFEVAKSKSNAEQVKQEERFIIVRSKNLGLMEAVEKTVFVLLIALRVKAVMVEIFLSVVQIHIQQALV